MLTIIEEETEDTKKIKEMFYKLLEEESENKEDYIIKITIRVEIKEIHILIRNTKTRKYDMLTTEVGNIGPILVRMRLIEIIRKIRIPYPIIEK
jgi:hypothetical protein